MKRTTAVIFPDTVPLEQVLSPLVLVFEQVVYCQPIENDDSGQPIDTFNQEMLDRSFCRIHSPAPLEGNRERFLHLIRSLQQRRDDYAAQLTHVSLAGISSGSQPGTESKASILSNLLSGHGIENTDKEQKDNLLWQARLVLKLGEQYDAEQKKVDEEMRTIHEREQKMFSGVVSGNNIFHLTGKLAAPVADTNRMQRLRLKAWSRMFGFGSQPLTGIKVFVSTDPDAVDRILEECERDSVSSPNPLITLQLPVRSGGDNYLNQLLQFKQDEAVLLDKFSSIFENPSPISEELLERWNPTVEKYFPASEHGRCKLTMYSVSGVRVKQLFLDSFGHDEDEFEAELAKEVPQDMFIGLLAEH